MAGTAVRRSVALVLAAAAGSTVLAATARPGAASADGLDRVRSATARFHDVDTAVAAGFAELRDAAGTACIAKEGEGAMGVHHVSGARVQDPGIEAAAPEALVYAPGRDGAARRLVAVEWVVLRDAWHGAGHADPPALFGRRFELVPEGNRYGLPAFYAQHAWVWDRNPAGTFAAYSPRVSC